MFRQLSNTLQSVMPPSPGPLCMFPIAVTGASRKQAALSGLEMAH